jgi:hypothetical protein
VSGREGTPWWYSGEDEPPADEQVPAAEPVGEPADEQADEPADEPAGAGLDWSLLVAGAQWVMDWAAEKVVAPHAEHADPAEHPQCVVCRTLVLIGDTGTPTDLPPEREAGEPAPATSTAQAIRWIPILDGDDDPQAGARQ